MIDPTDDPILKKREATNVKYKINYGTSVGAFPKSALDVVKRAGADELKVLLFLCSCEGNADEKKLAKLTGCKSESVRDALCFWRGAGIIDPADETTEPVRETEEITTVEAEPVKAGEPKKKLHRSEELPNYTSAELADILEKRGDTATLINECQNIMGKVFNVREINVLIGLCDYLTLDTEYIMILLTYCMSIGKKNLHFAEKLAFSLYDAGICTSAELAEELRRRELAESAEGRIRAMFGIGDRAFTTKEKKMISAWLCEMGYPIEIIERAYEATADATGKGSIPYANSILERWHSDGLRTLDEIESSIAKKKGERSEGSFNTDDFFDAAIKRALGEK